MRIGWDIDGVGFNFGDSCKRYLDEIGQGHLWKSGPTPDPYWYWYRDWGWTDEQFLEFCHAGADAGFIFSGPVRDGYKEGLEECARLGHEIIVITDRSFGATPRVSEKLTELWFDEHGMEYDELWFSRDKTVTWTDMFIDDKLENYDDLNSVGTEVYLLNRPWNEDKDNRRRVDDISEFMTNVRRRTNSLSVL